jgi:type IV pilus assembly protein PilV
MKPRISSSGRAQSGVMLIEALIALLIFSLGVLGIVGLQSTATKVSGDARYRSEAALMANELIGKMWAGDRTPATMLAAYDSSQNGPAYQAWAWVGTDAGSPGTQSAPAQGTVLKMLPGARTYPPVVTVTPVSRTVTTSSGATVTVTTAQVSVTIKWQAPQEDGDGAVHSFMTVAHIGG